ncbi:MAG: purine/pyrimidine permease [Burkholderiaceae bacterium]|nr:purine/pyrimidine permease [Burkholderiaceae bacterium]
MKRPSDIAYWLDDIPPRGVVFLSALQHIGLACSLIAIPLAVAREAGLAPERTVNLVAISMLVLGITTILQTFKRGPVGSGMLAPSSFSGAYLAPSLVAAKLGGLPLVFGMTIIGGLFEALLSRGLRYLRPFLPPEIAGFVVMLVGVGVGVLGVRYVLGVDMPEPASHRELGVAMLTLGIMVGLNVWGRGMSRLFCALIGILCGYVAALLLGVLGTEDFSRVMAAPGFRLPHVGDLGWSFDGSLIVPFAIGALAACLKTVGDLTICQRINDADWSRPDLRGISRGTLANAIGSTLAGVVGTTGLATSTSNIGLAGATGVTSRRVGQATGAILILLAFLPQFAELLSIMPRALMGAALMFVSAFILVNGLQIIASRLLDVRRTFVIGLSFVCAIAVDMSPVYFKTLPAVLQPLVSSSMVTGMVIAILLNLVFRIGTRQVQRLEIATGELDPRSLGEFMEACGASWGARRDVIERAKFNLQQSIETLASSGLASGPMLAEASFDDFTLSVRVSYEGAPLELPDHRPSDDEIMESDEGERKLAGFMLRKFADRVAASHRNGRSTVSFQFVH